MKIMSLLTAAIVVAVLYLAIFERDVLRGLAQTPPAQEAAPVEQASDLRTTRMISVVVQRSVAREIDNAVVLRGRTEALREVEVRAETTGTVISEPLPAGSFVEAGDTLCRIDAGTRDASLLEARARLAEAEGRVPEAEAALSEARANVREAEINVTAARRLSQDGFASETRLIGAEAALQSALAGVERGNAGVIAAQAGILAARAAIAAAENEIARLTITAPFAGVLETDTAQRGLLMQPGAPCAVVIQLDPIKLVGFIPEMDVRKVALGSAAGGRLASGGQLQGEVSFLARSADPTTRTFRVEVQVPNPDLAIRDGETAEILVATDGRQAHLLPQSALTLDDAGTLGLRTLAEGNVVRFMPVDLLRDTAQGVLLTGLPDAVDVIVTGQEYVVDGVTVTPTWREAEG